MDKPEDSTTSGDLPDADQLPFVAPNNQLPLWAALDWMSLGWSDFRTALRASLIYGAVLVLASYLLAILSWKLGGAVLLISLLSGLVFIAPVLALGLYSISCQIESGHKPKLSYCVREGKRHLGNELVFSFVLLIVFLLWLRAGSAIHIFFPMETEAGLSEFIIFYTVGSLVGAIFASIVFCASAFSLPLMMDRKADAVTAVLTSVNAVMNNKLPMLIWVSIIVTCVVICFMTAFIGMAVLMPVLGYATWHGYKQTINASQWEENTKLNDSNPRVNQVSS